MNDKEQTIEEITTELVKTNSYGTLNAVANHLYNAGYRKQREGEWVKTETNYTCSKCNFNVVSWSGEYDGYERERGISLMNFCPNCGAHMKGANDEN